MQFQLCVIDDGHGFATDQEMADISALNQRMMDDGQLVFAGGLAGPDQSFMIDNRGDEPLIEAISLMAPTPYYAGFWIIEVADGDVARELALSASRACNRRIELRRFLTLDEVERG